ncbi:MAG: hypothetical protein NVSMB16_00390 [Acidimicrobiales bacterium]
MVETRRPGAEERSHVADVVFVVMLIGFFALAALLVVACERIIGGSGAEGVEIRGEAPATERSAA